MSVKSVKTKNRTKKRKKEEKTGYPGIYVSKSGKYFIRQRLTLADGSIIQPRKTFDTLTEAILQKEMIKEGSSNLIEKYDLTVKEVCELYIQFKSLKSEDVKSTTIYDLESSFKKRVLPFFGDMKINKITPTIINEWKEWLVEKGYAFNTRKNTFTNTKAMFEHAVKYYSLAKNPFNQVNSFKEIVIKVDEKFRYYTHDQFLVFVDNAEDESPYRPYKLMFEFDFYLGLRNGEAQSFFFTDVDWVNETIKVYKNLLKVPKKYHLAKPRNEEYLTLTTAWQKANLKDWELIDRPKNNKSVR